MVFVATVPYVLTKAGILAWLNEEYTVDAVFAALDEAGMLKIAKRATNLINSLADFVGYKTEEDQVNQFPRGGDTDAPWEIEKAMSLITYDIWKGNDADTIVKQGSLASESTGSASVSYLPGGQPSQIFGVVPSYDAYQLLAPFRIDTRNGSLERSS